VQRLCELPQDLLTLAIHRLVLVIDMDVLGEAFGAPSDAPAPDAALFMMPATAAYALVHAARTSGVKSGPSMFSNVQSNTCPTTS
jgi:hypothetical protein